MASVKKKADPTRLTGGVHVSASLKRGADSYGAAVGNYDNYAREITIDQNGNLIALGACGRKAFVCSRKELPTLIDFLSTVAKADKS
jgi:hypothetical protein